jgi:hypothetical protein
MLKLAFGSEKLSCAILSSKRMEVENNKSIPGSFALFFGGGVILNCFMTKNTNQLQPLSKALSESQ